MKLSDFDYDLPEALIAQFPCTDRAGSRLLHVDSLNQSLHDRIFTDIKSLLTPGDLLVLNDTKVIPARLFGQKATGGQVEIVVERVLSETEFVAQIRASKTPKPDSLIHINKVPALSVINKDEDLYRLRVITATSVMALLEQHGHVPLPPYINRTDESLDLDRYQTVYAKSPGAVAAPTAGLHFTEQLLNELRSNDINIVTVTLHVGAGTFQPVRVENIDEHKMHSERYDVPQTVIDAIMQARQSNKRVIAVGTTALRSLEAAASSGELKAGSGETDLFIMPGFKFKVVDALLTNFHLPQSTLLMLVSAFAGHELIQRAYAHAVEQRYRFFSYGDAMFINR